MTSPDGLISFRLGPQSVAYSRRGNYPRWEKFGPELHNVVHHLFRIIPKVGVTRIGLRYINALKSDVHGIHGINDVDITISVAGETLSNCFNLNFKSTTGADQEVMSRIATADLAEGIIPQTATLIVDVDVYTVSSFNTNDADVVKNWITQAHDTEKESFFRILGERATERLRAD